MSPADGWSWLAATPQPPGEDERLAVAKAAARSFGGADGDLVLEHLRAMTLERTLGAEAPDSALRALEGQRQLVLYLISLVARGRSGM